MKFLNLLLLLMCVSISMTAAPLAGTATLKGKVTDAADGSALNSVTVFFPELNEGTTTNDKGEYFIDNLPVLKTIVEVSYLGHQTIIKSVDLKSVSSMDFTLKESSALINEVVVTGLTGNALMKHLPAPVTVVSNRDLTTRSSTNIIDAIAKQPGVSQITTGSGISKPVIRGLGYNRIVVVNDKIRQEGQQWGDEHGIEIDPQTINSVEIIKGPASLMYGSDAMAGVIIFREEPVLPKGELRASVTSEYQTDNGLFDYSLDMAGNKKGLVWNWRYSDKMAHDYKNKYDGYVYNSRFHERALSGMLGVNRHWGYSHLTLDYYHLTPGIVEGERDEKTGGFIKPAVIGGKEGDTIVTSADNKKYGHDLPYQQVSHYKVVSDNAFMLGEGSLNAIFGYQQNVRKEFEDVLSPSQCGLHFVLHTVNYDVYYTTPENQGFKFNFGVNGMYQRSLNKGNEYLIPAYNLFDFGVFATGSRSFERLTVSGGLRYDNRHVHGDGLDEDGEPRFTAFSRNFGGVTGSLGAIYNVDDNLNVRLNVSRGFRAPNMSELASNGEHEGTVRYEVGNQHLKPEYSWQFDLGCDYSSAIVSAQLSVFANRINNFIFARKMADSKGDVIITDGKPTYQFTSGDARLLGGEASVDVHPVERLHFENTFSYVNSVQMHQPRSSKYLPFTPAPRFTSELRYDLVRDGKRLNNAYVSFSVETDFRQSHFYAANGTETATPAYTLLNAAAGTDIMYHGKRVVSIYLTGENLANKAYQSHLNRLKYTDVNVVTGRQGVFNMGRNFGVKVQIPILL
jgi:iron complex outermembrane receptor protein